jgi:hypothetical protein
VADAHAQVLSHALDVEQVRQCLAFVASHDASSPAPPDETPLSPPVSP